MRKIILAVAVSLDNFIEGPKGEYDWCFTDQDYGMKEFLESVDAVLYGRKSYELMIRAEGGLTGFGNKKNYVFSNSLQDVKDGELIKGDAIAEIRKIKALAGKNIWLFGGAELATSLMNERLIDEIWVSVHPILLGAGKPLFIDLKGRMKLSLVNSKVYETGLVSLRYAI